MAEKKSGAELGQIAAALVAVQGELHAVKKDNTADAGKYSYTYADLASVWDTIRPLLSKNGIAVIQMPEDVVDGNTIRLRTMILHTSGEYLTSTLPMPFAEVSPQAVGSALTYARRYALCAMLGVATEDDDAAAAHPQKRQAAVAQPRRTDDVTITRVDTSSGSKNGKDWTRFMVHFSDGAKYSTLDDRIGNLATQLEGTGEVVTYETEQRGKYTNLKALQRVQAASPAAAELGSVADAIDPPHPAESDELTLKDIPF